MKQNDQQITEGFLSNIGRGSKLKNILNLRNQRDTFRKYITPEGFSMNYKADVLNTGAQALRKNQNALRAMDKFQMDTKMYQPRYYTDVYNRMSFGGIKTAEQMALDSNTKQIRESIMRIPIKQIILENDILSDNELRDMRNEDLIWRKTYPELNQQDMNTVNKSISDRVMDFNPVYDKENNPISATNEFMQHIAQNDKFNNPLAERLFNHIKATGNAYAEAERHIQTLSPEERSNIDLAIRRGNMNLGIPNTPNAGLTDLYMKQINNIGGK